MAFKPMSFGGRELVYIGGQGQALQNLGELPNKAGVASSLVGIQGGSSVLLMSS